MIIVDSCGWLEWFANGKLADRYERFLADQKNMVLPAIVLYEVYNILKREAGEEKALLACGYMKQSPVIPVDDILAMAAADLALQEKLAMADAIVLATAHLNNCTIITSDADLKNQSRVEFIAK
jgi:predicted nucleic acid-binding protein